jgi:peroxiredoxin
MNRSSSFKKKLLALSFSALFLLSAFAVEQGITVGKQAPDFKLGVIGGSSPVSLSQYRGKPVFLVFWATWCGPCRREIPALKELYAKFAPKGVQFVSVAVGWRQSEDDVARFKVSQQLPYQILWDKDNTVAEKWGVQSIPTNLILDQDGVIRFRDFGISQEAETTLQSMVKAD